MFYGGGVGFGFFFPFKEEWIKGIKLYSGTVLRISGWFMGAGLRFALPASSKAAHTGLKQSLILATQEFRDKGRFPNKGQWIQNVAGPELSPSNAAEEC